MTKEQEKQLDNILIMFHSDDTLYDNEEYHRRKKAIFTLVDRFIKAGQVEPEVKVNFAEIIENKKKQIYKSLSEYLGEAEVPVHRIVLLNLMAENECRVCDEILADIKSKISA